jgi:hypothetical protein
MDLPRYVGDNQGYRYVLLGYDTFSKFLTGVPLKRRTAEALLVAMETIVASNPFTITSIYSDRETGLMGHQLQAWFRERRIKHYTTTSKVKAPGVERIIRTLRMGLEREFEGRESRRWLDLLPQLINKYNDRKHSSSGSRPWDVVADPTLLIPHGHRPVGTKPSIPAVGSYVRVSRHRSPFEKEATGLWSREVFKVIQHRTRQAIPMLTLQDMTGEEIQGAFYPQEVQQITWDGVKRVQSVFKTRKRQGVIEYLVSFIGWPSNHREWSSDIS